MSDNGQIVASVATIVHMEREVSIRELRNSTASIVAELEAGARLTLTVNRRPVADIVPHSDKPGPWVASREIFGILDQTPADPALLDDLAEVRGLDLELD
jgi:antitoxin (DNA-binding transcriptional repressor) of toxin-antitoxin stability system